MQKSAILPYIIMNSIFFFGKAEVQKKTEEISSVLLFMYVSSKINNIDNSANEIDENKTIHKTLQ